MGENMKCDKCGGYFLEDYCACQCDRKEIIKLKRQIKDLERIFYAYAMGDVVDLPKRLQAQIKKMIEKM
jgi:hypothetical protein